MAGGGGGGEPDSVFGPIAIGAGGGGGASRGRIPEPALIRSVLVAITGVAAFILGRNVSSEWVETLTMLYGLAAPILAGLLIRPAVTPVLPAGRHARED